MMSKPGGEPWSGAAGHIDAAFLASTVHDIATRRAHICGPPAMMDTVKAALVRLGAQEAQIKTEAFGTVKRDPMAKGTASTELAGKVIFRASDTTAPILAGATILDAADDAGIFIDNACRSGTCGSCRVKLISGNVTMDVEDALTEGDKAEGFILACQAKILEQVEIDA